MQCPVLPILNSVVGRALCWGPGPGPPAPPACCVTSPHPLCGSPSSSVTRRPSHRHVCESTLQRKGSKQNRKRCSVLSIIRDEKINKKESCCSHAGQESTGTEWVRLRGSRHPDTGGTGNGGPPSERVASRSTLAKTLLWGFLWISSCTSEST